MGDSALTVVFTIIGGFAGSVYLFEVFLRLLKRILGMEDEGTQLLAQAIALEIEGRLAQASQRQVDVLERIAAALAELRQGE